MTVQGEINEIKNQYIRKGRSLQKAKLADATGIVEITWFNQPYITKTLVKGSRVSISGRVGDFRFQLNKKTIESPDYEMLSENQKPHGTGIESTQAGTWDCCKWRKRRAAQSRAA